MILIYLAFIAFILFVAGTIVYDKSKAEAKEAAERRAALIKAGLPKSKPRAKNPSTPKQSLEDFFGVKAADEAGSMTVEELIKKLEDMKKKL